MLTNSTALIKPHRSQLYKSQKFTNRIIYPAHILCFIIWQLYHRFKINGHTVSFHLCLSMSANDWQSHEHRLFETIPSKWVILKVSIKSYITIIWHSRLQLDTETKTSSTESVRFHMTDLRDHNNKHVLCVCWNKEKTQLMP